MPPNAPRVRGDVAKLNLKGDKPYAYTLSYVMANPVRLDKPVPYAREMGPVSWTSIPRALAKSRGHKVVAADGDVDNNPQQVLALSKQWAHLVLSGCSTHVATKAAVTEGVTIYVYGGPLSVGSNPTQERRICYETCEAKSYSACLPRKPAGSSGSAKFSNSSSGPSRHCAFQASRLNTCPCWRRMRVPRLRRVRGLGLDAQAANRPAQACAAPATCGPIVLHGFGQNACKLTISGRSDAACGFNLFWRGQRHPRDGAYLRSLDGQIWSGHLGGARALLRQMIA